jgi:carbon storage regulator
MLVLSRHKSESIMVGDDVEITVVRIRRNEIQLGITAPKLVPVYRKEVYKRINEEKHVSRIGYPNFYIKPVHTVTVTK